MTGLIERQPARSVWATPPGREPFAEVTVGPHRVALLKDGFQAYPAMLDAIAAARHSICLETYILRDDTTGLRFIHALMERAGAGVEVLLMYDSWGSELSTETLALLAQAGVKVLAFRPLRWNARLSRVLARFSRRNHRKSLIVDGLVAFTGGLNIANDYAAKEDGGHAWRDTHVRVVGPSAAELERLFLDTWRRSRGPAIKLQRFVRNTPVSFTKLRFVGNDFSLDRKGIRRAYIDAFNRSTRRILLTHAYFVPPAKMLKSLLRAAQRGVRVIIILAAATDVKLVLYASRGLYPKLLKSGVEVFEWHGGASTAQSDNQRVLHAKTCVVDGAWATIGSSNLDPMSLRQNLEVNALVEDASFASAAERMFEQDLASCERITLDSVRTWSLWRRVLSAIAFRLRHWL